MTREPSTPITPNSASAGTKRRRFIVLCPHFAPDIAPTGRVMTQLVDEWVALGHEVHVITALPWYRDHRVEPGWRGRLVRRERTAWGSITRVHPFPAKSKSNLVARAFAFMLFSSIAGICALIVGRPNSRRARVDAVIAMSPPLTLGIVGWLAAVGRRTRLIFNVQDVFPDAVIKTGAVKSRVLISLASSLERFTYRRASAVAVLSSDLQRNVRAKLPAGLAGRVHVIENFVDTQRVAPLDHHTAYRRELGLGDEVVVMYAGNVGFSQSLDTLIAAARRLPQISFVSNGAGAALAHVKDLSRDLANVHFGDYQPEVRLAEVLASADIHVVPLRAGLAEVSVPSKTYSILAAGRCVVAAVDRGTQIERLVTQANAGVCVQPDDVDALVSALGDLANDATRRTTLGSNGRTFIERHPSARHAAESYVRLVPDSLSDS
ncbi:MAG: glycosyltransferase family 4 protein [Actinomycetota bacterium]